MTFLVDTNVLSELRKQHRCNAGVRAWHQRARSEGLFVSVLTLGEIRRGIESVRRRDQASASALDRWHAALSARFAEQLLPIDAEIADTWARLNVPDPVPPVDGLIAATALVHDLTVVTRNIRDFDRTGARALNPFS